MSCGKFERLICLYQELTSSEKQAVDNHIKNCDACKKLWETRQQGYAAVNEVKSMKIELRNPVSMTDKIMQAIEVQHNQKRISWIDGIYSFFENLFVRYTTGAISLSLILFFTYEQQREIIVTNKNTIATNQSAPVLNTPLLIEGLRKKGKEKSGEEEITLTALYNCLKNNNCTKRELYYLKINKFYATN